MVNEKPQNFGICNKCRGRVPSEFFFRDGQTWIRKTCPECGVTESLVSTDAAIWQGKRDLWQYTESDACTLQCENCGTDHKPSMVFLDVTNRCNMNCPICIATIRGMGFDFNPPLEYFEKIFAHLGKMNPRPMVELFGGEPTVRKDLFEILAIGRRHGLKPRVVTNGLALADEEYAKKFCEARGRVRFGFDGRGAEIYERLRRNGPAYEKKMKGLANLYKYSRQRQTIISCAAWGINDDKIGDLIDFCHEYRTLISDIGIIPLTENWDEGEFEAQRPTTMEDVEKMVMAAIPGGKVEFVPAGLTYCWRQPRSFFRPNTRSETLLLGGVHPNCESITLLISDGKRYVGLGNYLRKPLSEAIVELARRCREMEPKLAKLDPKRFWQRQRGKLIIMRKMLPWAVRTLKLGKLLLTLLRDMPAAMAGPVRRIMAGNDPSKQRRARRLMRVAVLPFEEQHSVDADRMRNCKAVFAYEDVEDGSIKTIPACMWYPYRNDILKRLSSKYSVKSDSAVESATGAGAAE